MALPAQPKAQQDVVTTATHVLSAFEDMVEAELGEETSVVYDEALTFESGIKAYLNKNNFNGQERTDYPVFLYNRSQLQWPPGVAPSRRLNVMNAGTTQLVNGKAVNYRATQGQFKIQFLYLCRDVQTQERFEVAYQGERGISANRTILVDMKGSLGAFPYYLTYSELAQKQINFEDSAYTAIMGELTARGVYFTFTGDAHVIAELNLQVFAKVAPPADITTRIGNLTLT